MGSTLPEQWLFPHTKARISLTADRIPAGSGSPAGVLALQDDPAAVVRVEAYVARDPRRDAVAGQDGDRRVDRLGRGDPVVRPGSGVIRCDRV